MSITFNYPVMVKMDFGADELRQLLRVVLPAPEGYRTVIAKEQQQNELAALDQTLDDERFYFVFNLERCEIEGAKGVDRWLGYAAKEFTLERYLSCLATDQLLPFQLIAFNMYRLLCRGDFKLRFSTQKYISLLNLKHYNGNFILFKKTTTVFQYDEKDRLLAQLNVFDKIGSLEHAALYARTTETNGGQKEDFERRLFEQTLTDFMDKKCFSKSELKILNQYALDESTTSRELAALLDDDVTTINAFNRRILEKARTTFTRSFGSAREVALYLKKERLL